MGLLGALNTAVSGLNVNQQNLNVLSQNISNANTPNYSNEVLNQGAAFLGGQGQGVSVESITRSVNEFLNAQVQTQTSVNSAASTTTSYYSQIQNLLGTPGGASSIDQGISSFFTAVQTLANSPSAAAETGVVNSATSVAGQISGLASSLQNLRLQADSDISGAINSVNSDLTSLSQTNIALERAVATGQGTAGLLDQRDAAISDLSQYIDIKPTYNADGSANINTTSGLTLLTQTTSTQLTYTPATSANTFINNGNLSPINVETIDANGNAVGTPLTLATGGPSSGVTTVLTGGKISALLTMRDSTIPTILGQLDQLAGNLTSSVNAINNAGTSSPPPNSYTGTTLVNATSTSQYSGSIRIAALDSNGNPIASPYPDETNGLQPLTLNLATLNTGSGAGTNSVDGIINTINQYFGSPQNKAELGNINNIQLGVASTSVPDASGNLSMDFNLDNISSNNAQFVVSGVTVLDSNGNTVSSSGTSGVTSTQPALNLGSYSTTAGSSSVTISATGTTLTNGELIYLNAPSSAVNGVSASALSGYFTVSNVSSTSFTINVPSAATTATSGTTAAPAGTTGYANYATVNSGQMINTGANGTITASLGNNPSLSPYYTVQANVATVDANGNIVTSTISYQVANNSLNTAGDSIGAQQATGNGTIVAPTSTQPILTASLVDANGNPLNKTNGVYGNQQGYLKITAANGDTVAIDPLNSQQLGTPGVANSATNQSFSQYFGLNNFFNPNPSATPGNSNTNAAINLSVESRVIANPSLVSTGELAQANASANGAPNFTYSIASGDNSISQQLAALGTNLTSFSAVTGLAASNTTFSQYAGQIIATTSTNSTDATNAQNDSQALLSGFTKSAQAVSGVNLDQELANTVIYQNAYAASARIITVVDTMFGDLINTIQ